MLSDNLYSTFALYISFRQACGATVGTLCSCLLMTIISMATAFCKPVTTTTPVVHQVGCGAALTWLGQVSFFWYPTIGVVTTALVGWVASIPTPGHEERVKHLVVGWCGGTAYAMSDDIDFDTKATYGNQKQTRHSRRAGAELDSVARQPMLVPDQ